MEIQYRNYDFNHDFSTGKEWTRFESREKKGDIVMARTPQQIQNKIKLDRWWRKWQKRLRIPKELDMEFFLVFFLGASFLLFFSIS